ncbi:hypothetical protein Tsubulata_043753, partial [Turnera subulata]
GSSIPWKCVSHILLQTPVLFRSLAVLHFLIGFLLLKNLMVYPVTERSKTSSQWMAHHSSKDAGLVSAIARQTPRCLTETFNTQTMERKEQMYNNGMVPIMCMAVVVYCTPMLSAV